MVIKELQCRNGAATPNPATHATTPKFEVKSAHELSAVVYDLSTV